MRFFNFNMANIDAWQASSLHEETVSAVQPYLILCFRMFQHFRQPVSSILVIIAVVSVLPGRRPWTPSWACASAAEPSGQTLRREPWLS